MRKLRKSMLFALLLAAVVSCGGGGGGGSSSDASTPVNMEINLKTDLSEAATLKVEAGRLGVPVQPEFIKEGFESYYDKAGLVSYPLSSVENQMVNSGSALLRIDSVNHTQSLEEQVKNKFNSYNLSNLTANMNKGSTLLLIGGNSSLKLSQIKDDLFSQLSSKPTISGNKNEYSQIVFIGGNFGIDKDVNLDSNEDMYNRIKIYDSNIVNEATIKGTKDNLVGIGQREKNNFIFVPSITYSGNILINGGTINLSGNNSIGIFNAGWKIAGIQNNGNIIVGKNSTGIYVIDKKYGAMQTGTGNIENNGNIEIGENSKGIYYQADEAEQGYKFDANILNAGMIKSEGNGAIGMFHNSSSPAKKNLKNTGTIELTGDKSIGMFATGNGKYDVENSGKIIIGNSSSKSNPGIAMYTNNKNILLNNTGIITLGKNSIGLYGIETIKTGDLVNGYVPAHYSVVNAQSAKIELSGKGATGIYLSDGAIGINDGTITTVNADGGSIGVIGIKDSQFTNNGTISVNEGSVGIYGNGNNAILKNKGVIAAGKNSVGMYSTNGANIENNKTIKLTGDNAVGMYLAENSKGINNGEIITEGIVNKAVGVAIGKNAEFTNNGKIVINSNEGSGIVIANGGIIKNYGNIQITGENSLREKRVDNIIVKIEGITSTLSSTRTTASSLGIYVDTLGRTKPIEGLSNLGLNNADLLIGAEATEKTNATEVTVGNEVLEPFNKSIQSSNIANWNVKTGSLVWEADSKIENNKVSKVTLKKQSYAKFADSKTTEAVAKGLDEKYTETAADSKDKQIFNYLNSLNDTKALGNTYREINGSQYINVQQRIAQTDNILENKLLDLQKDNFDKSGHHVSTFFRRDNHDPKTLEIPDSHSTAYGISYLFSNADLKQGIYAGTVINKFKFKDNGRSRENVTMFKLGAYKTFDLNDLEWTLSGDGFASQNDMKRRFVIGNNVYENKADYNTYGFAIKNELGKTFQVGENVTVKPYAALKLGYGKFTNIKEKDGTLNMEVKGNNFYSVKPALGVEVGYSAPIMENSKFKASLGLGYEHELGKIEDNVNEAKFANTNTKINLKGAKDERRGNFKSNLKVGFEAGNFNFSVNGGYDTKDKNSHIGMGLGVSF